MPLLPYVNRLEPAEDAVIWRYLDLRKFRDLMASEELYFRRADLFHDKSEGVPPEQYAARVLRLDPYDIRDRRDLDHHLGSMAQHRESYYISCWHLFKGDTLDMWEQYGHDGVAISSRYGLLKSALEELLDETHLGMVRYGTDHLQRFNALEFITTKQSQYKDECEVRAILTAYDPLAGGNRHFDLNNVPHPAPLDLNPRHSWVPEGKRRRIDLQSLITEVVISPWAEAEEIAEITLWMKEKAKARPLRHSDLTGPMTPTLAEFRNLRRNQTVAPEIPPEAASMEELDRLQEELSKLEPSRVRFLYRQRWESCRLGPEGIPSLAEVQRLERTLRAFRAVLQKTDVGKKAQGTSVPPRGGQGGWIDRTLVNIVSILIGGAGLLTVLTEFNVPELNMSFFEENPFAVKRDVIETTMTWLFTVVALAGLALQLWAEVWGAHLREHAHKRRLYIQAIAGGVIAVAMLVWALTSVGNSVARREWQPKVVEMQRVVFDRSKFIIEHDGWTPEHWENRNELVGKGESDRLRSAGIETAENGLAQIEDLLDVRRSGDLLHRVEALQLYFRN